MDTIRAIKTRRSVRQFTNKKASDDQITQVLEAAMSAPSAYNHQPWQFIVVTDKTILGRITSMGHYVSINSAMAGILVCGDVDQEENEGFLIESCSVAIENMLITATDLGLGAAWASVYPFKEEMLSFQRILNLPKHILPITFVPLGYPDYKIPEVNRFDETKVHHN
jgi:nitroreductase